MFHGGWEPLAQSLKRNSMVSILHKTGSHFSLYVEPISSLILIMYIDTYLEWNY